MAEQSTQSIVIDASPAQVMAVIADFEAYPEWAGSVKSVSIVEPGVGGRAAQVAFKIDAGPVRDEYELRYTWSNDDSVSWTLVKGQVQKAQQGSYVLRAVGAKTEVTYNLTVDLSIPMLGMLRRKAEKVIMDTALKELKRRVEGDSA
jgi:ribosome-associated toxin RatA of RatAB toxin-antitoxin module